LQAVHRVLETPKARALVLVEVRVPVQALAQDPVQVPAVALVKIQEDPDLVAQVMEAAAVRKEQSPPNPSSRLSRGSRTA
jgi:hypothetical protein